MSVLLKPRNSLQRTSRLQFTSRLTQLSRGCRSFHATSQTRFLAEVISSTHSIIEGAHSITGLSWAVILPLTALTVRLTLTLPLTLYARQNTQKQLDLHPLLSAWTHQIRRETRIAKNHLGVSVVDRDAKQAIRVKRRELYKRWDCGLWKAWLPSLSMLVWLPVMETLRNMSGAKKGLLGMMMKPAESAEEVVDPNTTSVLGGGTSEAVVDSNTTSILGEGPTEAVVSTPLAFGGHLNEFYEPTFTTEGALWFPDLTAPDPLLLMPFMLSGVMLLTLMPSRILKRTGGDAVTQSTAQRRLTNALRVVALAIGPLTLQVPSGMMVYWLTSFSFGYVQGVLLDIYMPMKKPVTPCGIIKPANKRP